MGEEQGKFDVKMLKSFSVLKLLKVEDINVPNFRLTSLFTDEEAESFHASIGLDGVIQPLTVFEDSEGKIWLADGLHRLQEAKEHGHRVVPCIVRDGSEEDAVLYSAVLNIHRGKVTPSDLALYVKGLKEQFKWSEGKIADKLKISKAYVSQLLTIASNSDALEGLKSGKLTKEEAYNKARGLLSKPKSFEKASFGEIAVKQAFPSTPSVSPTSEKEAKPLTDEDLLPKEGFKPLTTEDLIPKEEKLEKSKFMRCDFCGKICQGNKLDG